MPTSAKPNGSIDTVYMTLSDGGRYEMLQDSKAKLEPRTESIKSLKIPANLTLKMKWK